MSDRDFDIAIIGMSGEFPGAADIHQYWENIANSIESIDELTDAELTASGVKPEIFKQENYIKKSAVLSDIEYFDANFFGYSPKEAELIDPQQRKFLEHAWFALEDAAYDPYTYKGTIGVFAGSSINDYLINNLLSHPELIESEYAQQILFGNSSDYLATRVAHQLDLSGAAISIQTACSTSLVAVHLACQSLLNYQNDLVIVGGVSISATQKKGYIYSLDGFLSPDGHCRPFDADAKGTIFSSGVGVMVLKRYADAVEDGDSIYAVIKGTAVNNDGSDKVGYTAPSVDGQAKVVAMAQAMAGVEPAAISYIETHGTGTSIGDPIEIKALKKVFANNAEPNQCALGSVKANFGHLDSAAGIAGLIKTALALQNQKLPPLTNFNSANSKLGLEQSPFYVSTELSPWPTKPGQSRMAGVSCFGIGGTNSHVIVEETPPVELATDLDVKFDILMFSAKTKDAVKAMQDNLADHLEQNPNIRLADVAYTLKVGRHDFAYRSYIIVTDFNDAIQQLRAGSLDVSYCDALNDELLAMQSYTDYSQQELDAIALRWLEGQVIDWSEFYAPLNCKRLHLPTYPMQRAKYWIDVNDQHVNVGDANSKKQNIDEWFYLPCFKPNAYLPTVTTVENALIIVFRSDAEVDEQIFQQLQDSNNKVFQIFSSDEYSHHGDRFQLNFSSMSDYEKFFEEVSKHATDIATVYLVNCLPLFYAAQCSQAEFNAVQSNCLNSMIYAIQAYEKSFKGMPLKISLLTSNLIDTNGNEAINPNLSPLYAVAKVFPKEYGNVAAQIVDIAINDNSVSKDLDLIINQIFKPAYSEEELAIRNTRVWYRDYQAVKLPAINQHCLAKYQQPVILITGGLGQLGMDIADYFSKFKNIRIALLTRSKFLDADKWQQWLADHDEDCPIAEKILRLQKMQANGANVKIYSADVSDLNQLTAAVNSVRSELGEINGVVHAAGETENGIVEVKDPQDINASFSAKVHGSYNLFATLLETNFEFMILCSSMNSIIGGLGQFDNTAANSFIDCFAQSAAKQSAKRVFAINWGAVNASRPPKVNVLEQFIELSTEHKKNKMTDPEIHAVYDRILSYNFGPRLVVSTIDFSQVLKNWNFVASVDELAKERQMEHKQVARNETNANYVAPVSAIQLKLCEFWEEILGINGLGVDDDIFSLGGHSLACIQFINKVKQELNIKTHVMNIYEMPTVSKFSAYIEQQLKTKQSMRAMAEVAE